MALHGRCQAEETTTELSYGHRVLNTFQPALSAVNKALSAQKISTEPAGVYADPYKYPQSARLAPYKVVVLKHAGPVGIVKEIQ